MRYYLDTNILVFILTRSRDDLDTQVKSIVSDFSNILYASSVAVNELIYLYKSGKVELINCKSVQDVLTGIRQVGVEMVFYNSYHLKKYIELNMVKNHKDMNDHAIIAQAISDKIPLISSDRLFENYKSQGLNFIYNKR
jgi:PIN domain nuclease of toxin-antitoxin system